MPAFMDDEEYFELEEQSQVEITSQLEARGFYNQEGPLLIIELDAFSKERLIKGDDNLFYCELEGDVDHIKSQVGKWLVERKFSGLTISVLWAAELVGNTYEDYLQAQQVMDAQSALELLDTALDDPIALGSKIESRLLRSAGNNKDLDGCEPAP